MLAMKISISRVRQPMPRQQAPEKSSKTKLFSFIAEEANRAPDCRTLHPQTPSPRLQSSLFIVSLFPSEFLKITRFSTTNVKFRGIGIKCSVMNACGLFSSSF